MGQLSRTGKLLKQVGNRPHASIDDHEDFTTPPPRMPPTTTTISSFPSVVKSIEVLAVPSSRPRPSLPHNLATGDQPKLKRKQPEIIDLDSPVKRPRLSATEIFEARTRAESSLPSPAQTESLKSWSSRKGTMQRETDVFADPQSSSDVEQATTTATNKKNSYGSTNTVKRSAGATKSNGGELRAKKKSRAAGDVKTPKAADAPSFKVAETLHATARSKETTGKPKFNKAEPLPICVGDEELDDSSDNEIFSSQQSQRKQKQGRIPARSSQSSAGYGKHARRLKVQTSSYKKTSAPPKLPTAPERVFKRHDLNAGYSSQMCSPNVSLSETEELADESEMLHPGLNDDEQGTDDGKLECKICHERLRRALREQFEDEILKDKLWTFKWQGRFCSWHKKRTAHEIWQERGYPEVNWDVLRDRMRKHDKFLLDVLNDKVDSYHRDNLREDGKHGPSRQKDLVTDGNGKFVMGYYGQKGERQVHEYIMTRFAEALRKRSSKDKLILAAGMQGGVNGIVQLVLAPHLAELLVKEDLQLSGSGWEHRAREVLAESAEIGELLFPEEWDKVGEDDYQDHIVEEEDDDDDLLGLGSAEHDIEVVELE